MMIGLNLEWEVRDQELLMFSFSQGFHGQPMVNNMQAAPHPPGIRPRVRARRGQATDPHSIAERVCIVVRIQLSGCNGIFKYLITIRLTLFSLVTVAERENSRKNQSIARFSSKCQQGALSLYYLFQLRGT